MPFPKPVKRKKSSRKSLIRNLDTIVSLIVRKRDRKCVTCGSMTNLQCGHLFSRSHYSARWDLKNCNTQCAGCNLKHEFDWKPYNDWFIAKFGQDELTRVYTLWKTTKKWKDYELEELYTQLKAVYEDMT